MRSCDTIISGKEINTELFLNKKLYQGNFSYKPRLKMVLRVATRKTA